MISGMSFLYGIKCICCLESTVYMTKEPEVLISSVTGFLCLHVTVPPGWEDEHSYNMNILATGGNFIRRS